MDKLLPYIVTAFVDIGREHWNTDRIENGVRLPHYLKRNVANYMKHFSILAQMKNPLVVFVSENLIDEIENLCRKSGRTDDTFSIHPIKSYKPRFDMISSVVKSKAFVDQINPHQKGNPEYWSPEYVYVTSLKAQHVVNAYSIGVIPKDRAAAWVDFGYCRSNDHLPDNRVWNPSFNTDKINLFVYAEPQLTNPENTLEIAVKNNVVYVIGGVFLTNCFGWYRLSEYMDNTLFKLVNKNLVDDDQGLLLGAYFTKPEEFVLHKLPQQKHVEDVRSIFRIFNE